VSGGAATDPAELLAPLAHTLSLDGYHLEVEVVAPPVAGEQGRVRLAVSAGDEACEECLVPEDVFAAIAGDSLGPSWVVEVRYPGTET